MKELFYELIEEAKDGYVTVVNDAWPVGFDTIILENEKEKINYQTGRNLSTLFIKNEEEFFNKLEEYLLLENQKNRKIPNYILNSEKDKMKWIMMYLFSYATTEDFLNPETYIQKRIDFLKDHSFDELEEKISVPLDLEKVKVSLEIKQENASVSMETPKKITFKIVNEETEEEYDLPSIYYAIRNENSKKTCYIYSLLKPKKKDQENHFSKKMNRLLFKINDGVTQTEDYNREDEANIKDVSMSFIFVLNIFISLLQKKNIETIKVVPYLPVAYHAREMTAEEKSSEELQNRNDQIQENLTNKLIRTFRRLCAQNDSLEVQTYPYELDEFLTLSLSSRKKELDNMLLEETNKKIIETPIK